ncbi:hypothetical protein [Kitasatospora sp. NPDC088134]|uniref:hypothetical protein n=1 Tax=Kitasatospora sp. NPDC088134 TaxID=3364071 RepID=UPI00381BC607
MASKDGTARTDGATGGSMDRPADGPADGVTGGSMDGPADGPADGSTGGVTDGSVGVLVAALVQPSRAGDRPGPELLARVVRELHRLPRWQHALLTAGAAPLDATARTALAEAVTELLTLDPLLAATLAAPAAPTLPPPLPPAPPFAVPPLPAAPPFAVPPLPAAPPMPASSPFAAPPVPSSPFAAPQFDAAPAPAHPFGAGTIVRRRGPGKGAWLALGAVLVAGVLVGAGVYVFAGSDAPRLPESVEGDRLRASSEHGDYPDWKRASDRLLSGGMVDPQAALYGSLPNVAADREFGGSDREARWNVVVGKPSPAFERTMRDGLAKAGGRHVPHRVPTSLPGTLLCDSYDPESTPKERAKESVTCIWYDAEHVIVVEGTGVEEGLPAAVVVRVHDNLER